MHAHLSSASQEEAYTSNFFPAASYAELQLLIGADVSTAGVFASHTLVVYAANN